LDKYNRTPGTFLTGLRIVSDRATQIPEITNSGVRQVVVRITSRQSTGKVKVTKSPKSATSVETTTPAKQQDCTEYIVLQKLRWFGEEEDWRIWGHTSPSTVDDLDNPMFMSGLSLSERMDAMKEAMGGRK
jgi:protein MBA1